MSSSSNNNNSNALVRRDSKKARAGVSPPPPAASGGMTAPKEDAVAGRPVWLHVHRLNGESTFLSLPSSLRNMKQIKKRIMTELRMSSVATLLSCNLAEVESAEHLRDGGQYLALGDGEEVDTEALPYAFHYVRKGTNFHVDIDKVRERFPNLTERRLEMFLLKFNVFDEDGDGLIDVLEAPFILEATGFTASKEEIHAALVRNNLDHKPHFDFYEFLSIARSLEERPAARRGTTRSMLCVVQ